MATREFVENTMEALDTINAELVRLAGQSGEIETLRKYVEERLGQAAATRPAAGASRRFDTKHLKLSPWNGDHQSFRTFEYHLKEFIKRESPELAEGMRKAELSMESTRAGFADVDVATDAELRWLLVNYTTSDAATKVRQLNNRTGIETWRLLKADIEPHWDRRKPTTLQNWCSQ